MQIHDYAISTIINPPGAKDSRNSATIRLMIEVDFGRTSCNVRHGYHYDPKYFAIFNDSDGVNKALNVYHAALKHYIDMGWTIEAVIKEFNPYTSESYLSFIPVTQPIKD
jgi:hypothetical protein